MTGGKNRLKHVERLTEINEFRNVASCWLYCANVLAMHGPVNVKFSLAFYALRQFYLVCANGTYDIALRYSSSLWYWNFDNPEVYIVIPVAPSTQISCSSTVQASICCG